MTSPMHFVRTTAIAFLSMVALVTGVHADPAAQMQRLEAEIAEAINRRDVVDQFQRYQSFSAGRLDASAGDARWSDKTGNCRLGYIDWIMRNQLAAPASAEQFTRELHEAMADGSQGVRRGLDMMAKKVDATPHRLAAPAQMSDTLRMVTGLCRQAFATLDAAQRATLRDNLYPLTTGKVTGGAFWRGGAQARALADLLERVDRRPLHEAASLLAALNTPDQYDNLKPGKTKTPHGTILVGSPDDDTYDLDALADVAAVIDLGGNDTYIEGSLSEARPVMIIIDLSGNDTYRGEKPGIQGGAILGASLLIDFAGNDTYDAQDVSQGSSLAGVGLLFDHGGNDTYRGLRRAQGHAICGVGLLLDTSGDDTYRAALCAQGFGGPLGIGVLEDLDGADHYYAGGLYLDSYDDSPGYAGWSQGVGSGPRGAANGGIGVILDGGGDDEYECDYFSHGGGYWFAAGFARDFGGNDKRYGSTRVAYDGGPRDEKIFLRWGLAYGCHYGAGFIFDDQGDDYYGGNTASTAFSWDIAISALCDFAGNDVFATGQGVAREAAIAILYNVGGDDTYQGAAQAMASPTVSYHPMPAAGGNFCFLIDYGGDDAYGSKAANNSETQRGGPTGFLIDRPE